MSVVAKFLLLFVSSVLISLLPAFADGQLPTPLNDEVLGLIVFKSTLEDPTAALASWSETDATPCGWPHVECDLATSHVLRLTLDSLSLSGPLPRGLDRLPFLESLSISNNDLSSLLPAGLSLLPRLHFLNLSRNAFSGRLPDDLGNIPSLRSLDLSSNSLVGPIPDSLFALLGRAWPGTAHYGPRAVPGFKFF